MSEKIKIGFIGLGNMGVPMAKNLIEAGYELTVYNRTNSKALDLKRQTGVNTVERPAELLPDADVIISMLTNDAAVQEVYTGADGIFEVSRTKPLIVIDMSTVSPETTRALASLAQEKGIAYLDAPVSGSVKPATEGQLVIMAGGEQEAFNAVEPILSCLGKSVTLLGDHGSGNVAKLAINLFLAITIQGLSEAVLLAAKNGITPEALLPLINAGAVASGITKVKTENIINDDFKAAFALKLLSKDLGLAEQIGLQTPAGLSVAKSYREATQEGFGDEDMVAVYKHLAKNS
jgi:3-hydroxyisobutyrate dehydrogenase